MKVAILTTFQEFNPGYSLSGIVLDQCKMLTKYGNEVHLFVNEQYYGTDDFPEGVTLRKEIPFAHLKDYRSRKDLVPEHVEIVDRMAALMLEVAPEFDVIFTHDLVFTGWNMIYALGILKAATGFLETRWMHWVHSIPSGLKDWWNIQEYGPKHKLVFPNKPDVRRVAEQFRGLEQHVEVIPHIKDMRTWFEFCEETCDFIEEYPAVMQADIVQIFPASTDRLSAKRVKEVIMMFGLFKKRGLSICLVIANQWATGTQPKENVEQYIKIARRCGLKVGEEFVFTSEWRSPTYATGIPRRMLRELLQLSNLFIFPTQEESFGLVVPEAALSGGCLMVLNKSLHSQLEMSGWTTLYLDFGSYHNNFTPGSGWGPYLDDLVTVIVYRLQHNEAVLCKTFFRQALNMDSLYVHSYEPILKGSIMW